MMDIKKKLRKKLGFYYRFIKQYHKNKSVFNQLIDLQQYPLSYYSHLQQQSIFEGDVISAVERGDVIIIKDLIGQLQLGDKFQALSKQFFDLDVDQLGDIHTLKNVEQIVDDALAVRHSVPSLILQSSIMKRLLEPHVNALYLELMPNLRLHLPYAKVKAYEQYVESRMGRGKLNPHGQHKDSWRYHPKNTINVWVALSEATDKNGMSMLPQSADYMPRFDVNLQEIASGVKTYPSQHYVTDLASGDALMFKAELLHGSIINMSKRTRVALSMRCTTTAPQFHKRLVYNYIKVENGQFDNLSKGKLSASGDFEPQSTDSIFQPAESKNTSIIPVEYDDTQIKLTINGQLKTFPRKCPHAGTDLLNGELNEKGQLMCPSHRMCIAGKPCD
ncbi:MAG: phytanoyl-CoA dioxygenase family protein [Psychrosphaera sp.]|nr:phytanoyl-CoA dioxygenase family protein [Psychrosphaera sp.]